MTGIHQTVAPLIGPPAHHDLNHLIEEQISAIKDQKRQFHLVLQGQLVKYRQNMRYLRRIVPIARKNSVLLSSVFTNIVNRKRLTLVEVVEKVYYLHHLLEITYPTMTTDHLSKSHLTHPDHASPSRVSDVSPLQVVVELRKARTIRKPRNLSEYFKENVVLAISI